MKVEKFPAFVRNGRTLQWDTRQNVENPLIVLRKGIDEDSKKKLLKLSSDVVQEGRDFSSWGEWIGSLLGEPSKKIKVVGLVGTNGKTTTAALLRFLLVEAGLKVLKIGTLGAQLWSSNDNKTPVWHEETGYTTPESSTLQHLLAQAVEEKVDVVVMEVTSHAVHLERVKGIEFDCAAFLNFSQDHLDFHGSIDEYKKVKKSFFLDQLSNQKLKKSPFVVINGNDKVGQELNETLAFSRTVLLRGKSYSVDENTVELNLTYNGKLHLFTLIGDFQAENVLAAAEIAHKITGIKVIEHIEVLKRFPGIPGRMEIVGLSFKGKKKKFIVDFAHTPDSLEKNLEVLSDVRIEGKLWVVFGCGGQRDKGKRPIMGELASRYADEVVVTSDNPRTEDPDKIIDQIVAPLISQQKKFQRITDRKEAMLFCMERMGEKDVCLVAGRGPEEFQVVGRRKIPFKDAQVLRELACQAF